MRVYVLHRKMSKSGARLAAMLDCAHGSIGSLVDNRTMVIRHGNSRALEKPCLGEINKPEAIKLCADKRRASLMVKTFGLSVDSVDEISLEQAKARVASGLAVIARSARHEAGRGLWLCRTEEEILNSIACGASQFTPFLWPNVEMRFHVFCGEIIGITSKQHPATYDGVEWIDNSSKRRMFEVALSEGFKENPVCFDDVADVVRDSIPEIAHKLGVHYCAIDTITFEGKTYFLEANTAPEVDGNNLTMYTRAFRKLMLILDDTDGSLIRMASYKV